MTDWTLVAAGTALGLAIVCGLVWVAVRPSLNPRPRPSKLPWPSGEPDRSWQNANVQLPPD